MISFSTSAYDEFSPVIFKDKLVFCSNKKTSSLLVYQNKEKSLFDIFLADTTQKTYSQLFSKELTTHFNDGPVTFNDEGDKIVFARNLKIKNVFTDKNDSLNQIGLFFSEWDGQQWAGAKPLPFNSSEYSVISPCLSPHGDKLYFGSDMPGGYGGGMIFMFLIMLRVNGNNRKTWETKSILLITNPIRLLQTRIN